MKRVSMDSHQSRPIDGGRVKVKYQNLLQDYLELQKEFVSKKKKAQTVKLYRENLLAEVQFLRQRHRHLLKLQSPKGKAEFVQQQNSDIGIQLLANEIDNNVNEAVLKHPSPVLAMTPILNDEQELRRKEDIVWEPLRVGKKPKNCMINDKRVGKKKISLQDQNSDSVTMEGGVRESSVIPDSVMDSVNRTLANVEDVQTHLLNFLSLYDPHVLSQMPPLQRAQTLLTLAKATTTLFTLRLRCTGVHPDDHPVKSELERLSLYEDKLERLIDSSKAPLRPSATLNSQAATRFIEHAFPDLTSEQKQSVRSISRGEGPTIKYLERSVQKKRKYQSSEKQSVQTAAKEFLEKAARELLGDNKGGLVGPLQAEALDDDDMPVS